MVALVTGNGLGLFNASLNSLGGTGVLGQGTIGQAGGQSLVNVSNGNLVMRFTDEQLSGLGQDLFHTRTYNTQGALNDADGDGWRWDGERKVVLNGTRNTAGSTLVRTSGDGHEAVYSWTGSIYQSTAGSGAHDSLSWDTTTSQWIWTEGSSRTVERYDGTTGRLLSETNRSGVQILYTYDANGRLSSVKDSASGQELVLVYDAQGKLSRLDTRTSADGALTRQVYYGYDAAGRLSSVTTDLTPANNSITDGEVYTSTYTYDGDSFRITSVTQSDGNSVAFTYQLVGGDYRVSSVTDASGTTTFTYDVTNNRTDVSNGSGQIWSYFYDAQGQLLEVQTPAVNGQRLSTRYAYDADGNVTQVTDGRGNAVTYTYDAQGNRTLERDAQGNTVAWTYSTTNQVLNEIRYSAPATWNSTTSTWTNPAGSTTQVKRFVYDANNRLSHAVSATGTVTAYVYTSSGLLQREVTYTGAAYAVSGLSATQAITLAQATTWTDAQDKSRTTLSENVYDYRGNLNKRTAYASVDSAGAGVLDAAAVVTQYTYNEHGQLLQTIAVRGAGRTSSTTVSSTVYDGLGRVTSLVDANGTRTYLYNGTNRTVTVTNTAGMTVTQAYDTAGRLVSLTQSASGLVTRTSQYSYDAAGRLVMTQDPTGVRTYTFYDEAGRISARVDGVGAVVEYNYNEAGQKTQEKQYATLVDTSTWYNGTTVTQPLSQARPASTADDRSISYAYDAAGRLSTLTNTAGTVTTYTYDGSSQLVKQQTGDRVIRYFFDAEGRQVAQLDGEGYLREQVYDSAGRLQQLIRYATVTTASLRAAGTLAQLRPTAGQNLQTWYFYDGLNRQVGSVDEQQFVTATVYDDAANTVQTLRYAATYETVISTATTFATVQAAVASSPQQTATTAFDAMGRVGQKTATDGTITAYEYDTAGRLIRQTYALGSSEARVQTTRYDAFGQVTGSLLGEASNRIVADMTSAQIAAIYTEYGITYTYDAMGRVASARDAKGNRTMSYYDAEGRLTHVVNGLGEVNETVYNAFGDANERTAFSARLSTSDTASLTGGVLTTSVKTLVQAIRNATVDNRRTYTYNTLGLLRDSTDALGYLTSYVYNVFGEQSSVIRTIASGQTVTHSLTYNKRGEQLTRIDDVGGLARSTSTGYDAFGRVIRQTDGLGKATVTRYDNYGRTIVVSNPLNQSQSTTYDAFARMLSSVDALNQSTTYSYDDNTRTLTVTTPDGVSISSVKNRHGETLSVTDGTGYTTTYSYNLDGQRLSTTDALNQSTLNGYDEAGRLISVTDALGRITRYGYDAANRVITRTNANNTVTRYTFDGQGRQIRVTDAEGLAEQRITDYAYDRKGQVLTVTQDPSGLKLTTTYTYDGLGQQVQVARGTTASPNQQITLYTFDKLGRRISEQLGSGALNLTTQYHYDNNDQVTRKIDARNASTWYVYNDAGDLITTVDALGGVTSNAYDSNGNVTSSTRHGTALSTTVLATFGNRVVSVAPTVNSAVDQTTHYVYDAVDQVRYTVAANGAVSETVYDNKGQVLHSRQYDKVIVSTATKTVAGIAAALTSAGAQPRTTSYLYDEVGQLKRTTDAAGKIESYTYDAVGNRTSLTNKNGAAWNYSYDALNRLTEEASPAVSVSSINTSGTVTAATRLIITRFSYDALGNIKSRTEGVQRAALNSDPALDDLTQTRTTGYDYDAVGHQIRITSPGWYNKATGAYQQNADTTTPANTFQITTEVTYDALGNAVRNRVRVNNTGTGTADYVDTYKVYDILGRLTHDIDALKGVVTYDYDATGNQTTVKRFANALTAAVPASGFYVARDITASTLVANASLDRTLTTSYDLLNRKTAVQQDQVNLYSFTGSVSGSSTITAAPTVLYTYNALGQLTRQTEVARNTSGTTVQTGASNYYYYDLASNRTGTVDTLGYYTRSEYDALGKKVRQVEYANALSNWSEGTTPATPTANSNDRSTRLVYDAMGRLNSVVQEGVRYWQQSINAQTNVVSATQITGDLTVSQTTYDNVGNVKTQRDAANNVVTTNYDALGRVTQVIEPARATAKSDTADPFTLTVVVASPTTTYSVDAFGQVVREIRAAGSNQAGISQTTHTRYDAAGYEVQTIEANGSSLLYKVDVAGRRLEEKRQTSVTLSAWTVNGVTMTRIQTLRRTFTFDALGQQTATIDWYTAADNTQKSTTNSVIYNRFGEVEQQLLNGALQTRYTYDKVGNAIEQLNAQGLTKVDYDLAGNATRSNQDGDTTITTDDRITYTRYDLLGRALEQHLPAFEANINVDTINNTNLTLTTPIIQQTYDRWNNLLSRTDARGYITTYSYDHNNRQLTETLPETDILRENGTSYRASLIHEKRYDGVGNLIQDVDLVGPYAGVPTSTELRTRQHVYNAVGELTRDVDALGFSRNYRVDAHGNRVATQDALGTVLVQTYDAMDRQLTHGIIRGGNAVILKTNEYDQAGRLVGEITGATAVEETLASAANADWTSTTTGVAGTVRYTLFDERGNIVRTRNESKIEKGYEYNEYNRKVKEIDGLNKTLRWTYNEGDFGKLASRTDLRDYTYSFTYNAFGQMTHDSLLIPTPNGIIIGAEKNYTYYANGLSKAITEGSVKNKTSGTRTVEDTRTSSYEYDLGGNRIRETNSALYLAPPANQSSSHEVQYSFDEKSRLREVVAPAGNQLVGALGTQYTSTNTATINSLKYSYDELDNRRRIYMSTVNQKGGASTIDDWYAYDKEGRMLVGEGFVKNGKIIIGATKEKNWDSFEAGNLASTSPKGYLMSYDAIGRRVYSESFDRAAFAYTFDPVDREYYADYSGDIYLSSKYSYSDNNELIEITVNQVARRVLSDSSNPLETVYSGYGGTRNDNYVIFSPAGIAQKTYSASYDLAGRRLSQTDYKLDLKRGDKTVSTSVTTTSYTYRGDGALTSQISHKDGKLQQSSYFSELGMLDAAGNQLAYRYVYYNTNGKINHRGDYSTSYKAFDAYREDVSKITRTNGGKSGTTTNSYTSRGELIQTVGVGGNVFTRRLASNREGQLNVRQEASGASQRYIYQQGSSIANVGNASAPTITDSFEPILIDELARTPSNYLIEEGDTLQSIAQSIWGDSSLWYLIADANGLDTSKALVAGDNLRIPSVTSTNHNNSTTFKPYDPKDVIGDTKPRTVAPPPPKPKKKKCGGIASIVMVVVAVVATVFTAGAAALAMGAVASTTGVMAAGMAALTGSASLLGVGAAVVGGIAGSAAGQIAGKAMGVVDSFSWKQVAVGGLTAGFTAGIGYLAQAGSLGSWAATASTALSNGNASVGVYAAQGTVSYATSMAASKIVGLNTSFSWRNVAASAVGSAIAGYANNSSGISNSLIRGQVSAHASALIKDKWFGGDKPDYAQVAADAFGNTLGSFVVDQLRQPSANTIRHAQELARVSDNEATIPVIRHMLANGATPEDVGRIFNSSELREPLLHPTQATGNGGYLTYADDGVWVGVPPIEQPLTYTLNDQSYTINSNAFADRANTLVPPIHDGLTGLGRFAEANPNATQLLGYAAQGLSYALMGPVAALRDMASQAILGPVLDQARDYAIERISGFYQSKGVMAENAGVLASGTLFGMEAAAGRVTSAVTGAKQYVIQANGKSSRAKDFNFLNKSGMFYPSIPDLRTGRSVPFPSGELSRTPKAERVTWGAKERGDFIKAWYDHGYATPRGGWGNYDIHHIKPREFGGSNEFWNLTPVERGFHQQEYNSFWRDM